MYFIVHWTKVHLIMIQVWDCQMTATRKIDSFVLCQKVGVTHVVRRTGWIDLGTNPKPMIHTLHS